MWKNQKCFPKWVDIWIEPWMMDRKYFEMWVEEKTDISNNKNNNNNNN